MSIAADLFGALCADWTLNTRGGWPARWRRRPAWPALAAQRLGLNLRVSARLFWGERMLVLTGETTSRVILSFGYSETALSALLCDLLAPGQCAVDIGTHFGYEAMLMARLTGPGGSVHAFEPNPAVAAFAARNLASKPWVRLHQVALSHTCGRTSFAAPPLASSAFGGLGNSDLCRIDVEMQTLDHALTGRSAPISLIKCDAEGHEEPILRGAIGVIAHDHPALVLETGMPDAQGQSAPTASQLAALLAPAGYRPFCFEFTGELRVAPLGRFPTGHANTLYLPMTHPRFSDYTGDFHARPAGHPRS